MNRSIPTYPSSTKMIIFHLISFLLSLSAATPISTYQSPSSPLHKRDDINCIEQNGRNIVHWQCSEALVHMNQHLGYLSPASAPSERILGPFSRHPSDVRFIVPMFFRTRTCTIALDTIDVTASLSTMWSTKVDAAQAIINQCVAPGAIGGDARTSDGFLVMVINESALPPSLQNAWAACLRVGLRADITLCAGRPGNSMRTYRTGG